MCFHTGFKLPTWLLTFLGLLLVCLGFLQSVVVLLARQVAFKMFVCSHSREWTQCYKAPHALLPSWGPRIPFWRRPIPTLFFFHQQNVNLSKGKCLPKTVQCRGCSDRIPESRENLLSVLRGSIPCSALPPASSAFSRCQGSGILGREGLKWSSVSLSPCEVTKQNFISALSNWTTLITPVILFLPCVISLLGVKCLCAKFQSCWMPPLHRAAAPLSQASQRSRLHKIINAWMW